jgi:probable F420-dependent oxidoreductase
MRSFARSAEQAGYSAIAFTDHPAPSTRWLRAGGEGSADLFGGLAFCAAVTDTIRLMTLVLVLPYRNPLLAAHQVATLDALSDGRVTVGVGTGYLSSEMFALGADPNSRREAFDDAVEAMVEAWSGNEVARHGAGYSARATVVPPRPVQRPHPPLFVHGNGVFGRDRAARYGAGWIGLLTTDVLATTIRTRPLPDHDALAVAIRDLADRTTAAGRDASSIEVCVGGQWPLLDVRKGWDVDRYLDDAAALERLGVDTMLVMLCGDDVSAAEDTLLSFGEQVVGPLAR